MKSTYYKILFITILCLPLLLSACSSRAPLREAHFSKASFEELELWQYDCQLDALGALQKSCQAILKKKLYKPVSNLTQLGGSVKDWVRLCNEALSGNIKTNLDARLFFEKWFIPYKVSDYKGSSVGKFTGYYEIELNGSRKKTKRYRYPIYRPPQNLDNLKGRSSFTHTAINRGALSGKGLELAFVDNKARLFFMHIQGSGIVKLAEGGELKVGYNGQNGHSYKAIGPLFKYYCDSKIRSAVDMMEWLHKNPTIGKKIMEENPSYVFFREIHGESPLGGQGIPLTSERSIAIDAKLYPYGIPIWVETTTPKTSTFPSFDYRRLFIAQDTGGAIKGAIRGDIFYGRGDVAEELAGYMNNKGCYYILFPKGVHVPKVYKAR